ncbi:MAG: TraR/DksA family transcriptional regulator [Candidatus Paracaedibacter sp.]|jgi:DnaK suppressor protein
MTNAKALSNYDLPDGSDYLSEEMLDYFKDKLKELYEQVIKKEEAISMSLTEVPIRVPDRVDQGANEELLNQNYMFQEHENHLQQEIEDALQRIDEGVYGYCEETSEPIGLKRLLALPYARYCLKVQEHKEQHKKGPWQK